jgi:hypothetical protein
MGFIAFLIQSLASNLSAKRETEYEYLTRKQKEADSENNNSR